MPPTVAPVAQRQQVRRIIAAASRPRNPMVHIEKRGLALTAFGTPIAVASKSHAASTLPLLGCGFDPCPHKT